MTSTYSRPTPDSSDSSSNAPYSYWNPNAPTLRNSIASSEASDGIATLARTEVFYDDPATTGNPTQKTTWDSTKGGYSNPLSPSNSISISHAYDSYGNLLRTTDARGNVPGASVYNRTEYVYGDIDGQGHT